MLLTIKGENPVFGGKYFDIFSLEYSVPIMKFFLQITYPKERDLNFKLIKSDKKPDKSFNNGNETLTWELSNCPEVILNSDLPSWYIGYGKVQLSEFSTWNDVIQWGCNLYPKKNITNSGLEHKLKEITSQHIALFTFPNYL